MKNLEKFLEFNGQRITVLLADGNWWVAIRPICEVLGINYNRQFQNLKEDSILSRVFANQQTHDASNRLQQMLCIPEKYIYGWLFSVRSDSPELEEYKLKCYDILFSHFHGALTARFNVLSEQDEIALKIEELELAMQESDEYQEILALKKRKADNGKELKRMDVELKSGQIRMFN